MKKRILAILLALMMVLSMTPITTFADTTGTNVAKIGTTEYETLAAAFGAAQDGDTIELLSNVEFGKNGEYNQITFGENKNITLDLKGCTVTGSSGSMFKLQTSATLTLKDSSNGEGSIVAGSDDFFTIGSGCTVNITGGTYIYNEDGGVANVKNKDNYTFTITGGTFNFNPNKCLVQWVEKDCVPANGYDVIDNENGTWTVKKKAVAKIVETGEEYATVEDAIGAAEDGATITLLNDVTTQEALGDKTYYNCITFGYVFDDNTEQPYLTPSNVGKMGTFTIDGDNHDISFGISDRNDILDELAPYNVTWVDLTIKNCNVDTENYFALNHAGDTTMTIESGSYTTTAIALMAAAGTTKVTGGTFNGACAVYASSPVSISDGYFKGMIYDEEETCENISITGGYFSVDPSDYVADGCKAVAIKEGDEGYADGYRYKVVEKTATNVAKIGEIKYETLAAAVEKVQNNETITMLCNVELDSEIVIPDGKTFTIDLAQKTITTTAVTGFSINAANLTVKNGTVKNTNSSGISGGAMETRTKAFFLWKDGTGSLTLDGVKIETTGYSVNVNNNNNGAKNKKLIIKNCDITSAKWGAVYAGGADATNELTITNSKLHSSWTGTTFATLQICMKATLEQTTITNDYGAAVGCFENTDLLVKGTENSFTGASGAISTNGSKDLVEIIIEGGTFKTTGTSKEAGIAFYHPDGSPLTIKGGTFEGATALYVKGGEIDIQNGTFIGTGTYKAAQNVTSGAYATGDAVVIEASGYLAKENYNPAPNPSVSISGGFFKSTNGSPIAYYTFDSNNEAHNGKMVSGGYFDKEISADIVVSGKTVIDTPEGTERTNGYLYTIGEVKANVAKIGDVEYATLAEAFEKANELGTAEIKMIADTNITFDTETYANVESGKNITLDLNGKVITSASTNGSTSQLIDNCGTLTIRDSADKDANGHYTGKIIHGANPAWVYDGSGSYNGSYASNLIRNYGGTVTIDGGYLENASLAGQTGSAAYVVDNNNNVATGTTSLVINDGEIVAAWTAIRQFVQKPDKENNITVNGGSVTAAKNCFLLNASKLNIAKLTINGGTFTTNRSGTSGTTAVVQLWQANTATTKMNIEINGGLFAANGGEEQQIVELDFTKAAEGEAKKAILISGGYFNLSDNSLTDYVVSGKTVVDNDGTVVDKTAYPYTIGEAKTYVAKIGDVEYETLADAIAAVPTDGTETTITMIADVDYGDVCDAKATDKVYVNTVPNGKKVVLDLAGHTIKASRSGSKSTCIIHVENGGALTINDSSANETGTIELYAGVETDPWDVSSSPIISNGAVTVNAGTIKSGDQSGSYAVDMNQNGFSNIAPSFTMNGGKLESTYVGLRLFANGGNEITATINNGEIIGVKKGLWVHQARVTDSTKKAVVEINDGVITSTFGNAVEDWWVATDDAEISITINGGKFSAAADKKCIAMDDTKEKILVNGGYFNQNISLDEKEVTYIASGKTVIDTPETDPNHTDYPYTIGEAKTYVAKIGDVEYETLADAIAAVPTDGTETTITMIANEAIDVAGKAGVTIGRTQKIVLDLNGYTIAGICTTGKGSELIKNEGYLTIKDSSDAEADGSGNGKLTYGANPTWDYDGTVAGSYISNLITNRNTLTIESGYYLNDATGSACYVVDNYGNGYDTYFTLKGGKLVNTHYCAVRFTPYTNKTCVAVMQGGEIESLYSCVINYQNIAAPMADIKFCGTVVNGQSTALYESGDSAKNINDWSNFKLSVESGKFSGSDGEFVWMKAAQNFASGGYYKNLIDAKYIVPGYKCINTPENDPNHTEYPYTIVKAPSVAKIGNKGYETLAEAVAAAQDGDKIELLADIKLDQTVSVAKQITLDLGTFSITPADGGLTANAKTTKDALIAVNYGGDLTITGTTGKISSNNVASVYAAVKMTEKGEKAGEELARLTVNGGTLEGYYYGITGNGDRHNTEITVNGGTVNGTAPNDSAGIFNPQNGSLTVTGGTIEGAVGIYVKSGTVTTFTGGTIKGNGTKKDYVTTKDGFQQTGDAFVVDNCGYPGGEPAISITGSTFISANADAVASYAGSGYTALNAFITGGFFSSDVQSLVANGYKTYPVAGNDMWTVGADDETQKADTSKPIADVIKVEQKDDTPVISDEAAKEMVQDTVNNNTAVNNFVNSDIKDATTSNTGHESDNLDKVKEALKKEAEKEEAKTAIQQLENDVDLSSYVKVKTEAATVANFTIQSATTVTGTTVKAMTFDVKPYAEYTVKDGEKVVETVTAVIPNSAITSPITFRLPVEDSVPVGTIVKVYHSETEVTEQDKGKFFGNYKVQEEGGKKFIELASDNFSYFTYELTEEVVGHATFTATLNLADSIGIVMYVNNPTGTLEKYKVAATYKGITTETQLSESLIKDGRPRIVIADCAAAEMFETVHVVVTYDDINIMEFDYSVYDYCNAKINKAETAENLKELCRAALDYGCYARTYFKYIEEIRAAASENYSARGVSGVTASGSSATISGSCTGIKSVSATLSLESKTKIIFYLTPDTGYNAESYTYSVNGGDLEDVTPVVTTDSNGRIRVEVSGIAAARLDEVYTLTVTPKEGGSAMNVNYSPMGYAKTKQYSTTKNLPDLVKSLYVYWQGANAFFQK